jgi:integrase
VRLQGGEDMPVKGSYRKQGENSWEIRMSYGKNEATGEYDRYRETFRGTEKQCKDRIDNLLYEYRNGMKPQQNTMNVAQYLDYWFENYVKKELKPTTQRWYRMLIDKHIKGYIGKYKLADITPLHVENLYNQRREEIGNYNVKDIHICLSSAFNRAYKWRMMREKIMDKIEPIPRKERQKMAKSGKNKETWDMDQAVEFLKYAKENTGRRYYLYLLALTTALRRGENLGLKWDYVDFDNRFITVAGQLVESGYEDYVKDNEERYIYLPDFLAEELDKYRKLQIQEELLLGAKYDKKSGWVHSRGDGKIIMCCHNVTHKFREDIFEFNKEREEPIPVIAFHDLRHTCATLLRDAFNMSVKEVSEVLGHYEPKFTDKTYIHDKVKGQGETLNKFGDLLKKAF